MTRVLLVGNYRADRQFSMLGFESALTRRMPKDRVAYTHAHPKQVLGNGLASKSARKWLAYIDKYILFPRCFSSLEKKVDLVHIVDHGNSMWVPCFKARPVLVTCHDLLAMRAAIGEVPGWSVGRSGRKYQELIARGITCASHIVCDSLATRNDLVRILGVSDNKVSMLYLGLLEDSISKLDAHEVRSRIGNLHDRWPNGFLLHVGGNQPYKNRSGLLSLYEHLHRKLEDRCPGLVLAGHRLDDAVRDSYPELFRSCQVVEVVTPDTRTIWALYSAARGLIYPSLLEGFGLPLLEAQACSCPVFSSNRASLPEVGGSGALYFDPEDLDGAVDVIVKGLENAQVLVEQGTKNIERFTTERMVREYADLYESVVTKTCIG